MKDPRQARPLPAMTVDSIGLQRKLVIVALV